MRPRTFHRSQSSSGAGSKASLHVVWGGEGGGGDGAGGGGVGADGRLWHRGPQSPQSVPTLQEVEVAVGAAVVAAMAVVGELRVLWAGILADRHRAVGAVSYQARGSTPATPSGSSDPEHGTVLDGPRVPVLQAPLNVGGLRAAALRRRGLGPDVEALRRDAGADEPHRAVGRQPRDPGEEHALPAAVGVGAAHPRALAIEEEGAHLLQVDVHVAVGVDDVDELVEAHRRQRRAASSGQPFVEEREQECDERREVALPLLQIINRALHVDDVVEDPPAARAAG